MKTKLLTAFLLLMLVRGSVLAQDEEEPKRGFKKENLFGGGSIDAAFYSGVSLVGVNPYIGYRVTKFLDAGVVMNVNFSTIRDYAQFDDKMEQWVWGGGVVTRIFPFNFLFAQAQLEHNFISQTYKPPPGSLAPSQKNTFDANALLVGGGYTSGRMPGSSSYFYFAILWDVIRNEHSPYVDVSYNPANGQYVVRSIPIIRAGVNIGFGGR